MAPWEQRYLCRLLKRPSFREDEIKHVQCEHIQQTENMICNNVKVISLITPSCKNLAFPDVFKPGWSDAALHHTGKANGVNGAHMWQWKQKHGRQTWCRYVTSHHSSHSVFLGTDAGEKMTVCFKVWRLVAYWLWSLSAHNWQVQLIFRLLSATAAIPQRKTFQQSKRGNYLERS